MSEIPSPPLQMEKFELGSWEAKVFFSIPEEDDDDEFFCGMVDQRKAFNLISSQDHCQGISPLQISDTLQAGLVHILEQYIFGLCTTVWIRGFG